MEQTLLLLLSAYILSIGFGLVFDQKRGAKKAHAVWMKLFFGIVTFVLRTIGDLFHYVAKAAKR